MNLITDEVLKRRIELTATCRNIFLGDQEVKVLGL